jgi:Glycosyltransferase family 87
LTPAHGERTLARVRLPRAARFAWPLLAAGVIAGAVVVHGPLAGNLGRQTRIFHDGHEIDIYRDRGSWFPRAARPYTDVFSEYPQLATYTFAVPYAALKLVGRPPTHQGYAIGFGVLMAALLIGTMRGLRTLMPSGSRPWWLLMLLPAQLYFTFNRYDMLPAALSVASFLCLVRGRPRWAAVLLGLGVAAKWYLLVLVPVFARHEQLRTRRLPWAMVPAFLLPCVAFVALTVAHSGWEGLAVPYRFHYGRGLNSEGLFYLVAYAAQNVLHLDLQRPGVYRVLLALQFAVAGLALRGRIDSPRRLAAWSALSIAGFMLFAKFYSPQWIIWLMPFLALWLAGDGTRPPPIARVAAVVGFDLLTTLYFPLLFDGYARAPGLRGLYFGVLVVKSALLLGLAVALARSLATDRADDPQRRAEHAHD